jgi:hypothetical protein
MSDTHHVDRQSVCVKVSLLGTVYMTNGASTECRTHKCFLSHVSHRRIFAYAHIIWVCNGCAYQLNIAVILVSACSESGVSCFSFGTFKNLQIRTELEAPSPLTTTHPVITRLGPTVASTSSDTRTHHWDKVRKISPPTILY